MRLCAVNATTFAGFDAATNGIFALFGAYEYDAVALAGLTACNVTPSGSLPSNFADLVMAAKAGVAFDGLTGVVKINEIGNRAPQTANVELSNIVVTTEGVVTSAVVARFDNGAWNWAPAADRAASSLVYMGGATEPPPDLYMPPLQTQLNLLPVGLTVAAQVTTSLLLAAAVGFGVWAVVNRKHPLLVASQPLFLVLVLVGSIISMSAVYPLCVDHRDQVPQAVPPGTTSGVYPDLDVTCNLQARM